MKRQRSIREQAGATLVEVLVAIALTGIMLPALAAALITSHVARPTSLQQLEATSLMREATEAVRSVREKSWTAVATNGTYYPVISSGSWSLASGTQTINGFTRQIDISDAGRNGAGSIVTSGGTADPSTKHVVVTVSWTTPSHASVSSDSYLSRWQNNAAWTQTMLSDFTGGTLTNTTAANASGGEVQLMDSPPTWQLPSVLASRKITNTGLAANDVFVSGIYAYVGYVGGLAIINISNPAAPVLTGTYANGPITVYRVFVSGTTAYLATNNSVGQLEMIDVSNPAAPTLAGAFQILDSSEVAATSVYVRGTTAYVCKRQVTTGGAGTNYGEFNIVNVANPGLPTLIGSLNIAADCNSLAVSGTTAYLATSSAGKQLTVVDISNETNPTAVDTISLGVNGSDVTTGGTMLYVATPNNPSGPELRGYDISTPSTPAASGSYEVGASVNGISVSGNYLQLATSLGSKQFMVLDASAPATPTLTSSINMGATANHAFTTGSYTYLATNDTTKGLSIIYSGFRPNGTFESSSFDATGTAATAAFNHLGFTTNVPSGASLKFQVAGNTDNTTWDYIGPDGTNATYFAAPGAIPLSTVSNRYFRYKAYFTPTPNGQQTPVLDDVTLNYTP